MAEEKRKRYLPTYKGCLVCGQKETNPNTLNLRFEVVENGVSVTFKPRQEHEGYKMEKHKVHPKKYVLYMLLNANL